MAEGDKLFVLVIDEDRFWTGKDLSFSPSDAHFFRDESVANSAAGILHAKYQRPIEIRTFEHTEEI